LGEKAGFTGVFARILPPRTGPNFGANGRKSYLTNTVRGVKAGVKTLLGFALPACDSARRSREVHRVGRVCGDAIVFENVVRRGVLDETPEAVVA